VHACSEVIVGAWICARGMGSEESTATFAQEILTRVDLPLMCLLLGRWDLMTGCNAEGNCCRNSLWR